jgi:hypothetical protein
MYFLTRDILYYLLANWSLECDRKSKGYLNGSHTKVQN